MKKAIVSFANSNGNYIQSLARLGESLRNNFDGDFLGFINEASVGAPLHKNNPYAFKLKCIQKAIYAGYEQILWLDSSCFAIQNVQPIFDIIQNDGYVMQDSGHYLGNWCNDATLNYSGITRDKAMDIKMYGNAGFLGLSMESGISRAFFDKWNEYADLGYFKGEWNNDKKTESEDDRCLGHRHDMSCGSIVANILQMKMQPGDSLLQYTGVYDKALNDSIIIKAQGM